MSLQSREYLNLNRVSPVLTPRSSQTTPYHSDAIELISYNIDKGICQNNDEQPKRTYLGGSSLGSACVRQVQYRYMQTQPDEDKEFSARTLRIFDMGHFIEDMIAGYLRRAGFELKTHNSQGKQFGFSVADEQIRGHIDGVICSGPVPMKYPFLWECKSSNSKKFNEFVRKGVAVANPVYAAQVSLYQEYMDLTENPALFTVMNKDTSEIYYELIPFDKELAQKTSDRGVEILQATKAGEMLPRIAANSDYFTCKFCEFRKTCWS